MTGPKVGGAPKRRFDLNTIQGARHGVENAPGQTVMTSMR
jgi:hypothetical protein